MSNPQLHPLGGSKIRNLQSLLSSRVRQTIRRDPIGWASSCGIHLRTYQRGIVSTDHLIDALVYQFYGLTVAEIKIVEFM